MDVSYRLFGETEVEYKLKIGSKVGYNQEKEGQNKAWSVLSRSRTGNWWEGG